jgi:hypothetical protein
MKKNIWKIILGAIILGGVFTIYKSGEVKGETNIICDYPKPIEITEINPVSTCNRDDAGETILIKVRNNMSKEINDKMIKLEYNKQLLDTINIDTIESEGYKEIQYIIKDKNINYKDIEISIVNQ